MDRLDELRAFALAVDRGSLSAVARVLGRSSASITRAIDSLERRLGTPLLQRTTRSLKLTEAGERYLVVARRVLADLDEAERTTSAATNEPRGIITVTAPVAFGSLHVRPIVEGFLSVHADIRAHLVLLDRNVSLLEEGFDVAVRIGHLVDSALLATAVGEVRRLVVASPAYLAHHGRPRKPSDLVAHTCIASTGITPHETWTFGAGTGARAKRLRIVPRLSVNIADAAIGAALNGVGITCALSYQVSEHLETGALVRVLRRFEPPPVPVHVLYAAASARTAKVRSFVDLAVPRLRGLLALVHRLTIGAPASLDEGLREAGRSNGDKDLAHAAAALGKLLKEPAAFATDLTDAVQAVWDGAEAEKVVATPTTDVAAAPPGATPLDAGVLGRGTRFRQNPSRSSRSTPSPIPRWTSACSWTSEETRARRSCAP